MVSQINNRKEIEIGMSNFDHSIDEGLALKLKENPMSYALYTAWNFCGRVWYENNEFRCEIWLHGSPVNIIHADTLESIMEIACNTYGYR